MNIEEIINQIPFRKLSINRCKREFCDYGMCESKKEEISNFIKSIILKRKIINFANVEKYASLTNDKSFWSHEIYINSNDSFIHITLVYDRFYAAYDISNEEIRLSIEEQPYINNTYLTKGDYSANIYSWSGDQLLIIKKDAIECKPFLDKNHFLSSLNISLDKNKDNLGFLASLQSKILEVKS